MGKRAREPLKVDINSNMGENEIDDFCLHDLLDVALKAGRFLFFGISYSISPSQLCCSEFNVKNHGKQKIFLRFLHFGFFLYLAVPFLTISISLSPCSLVNLIKKGLHVVLAIATLVAYYTLEVKGRHTKEGFVRIFKQCAVLQKKFRSEGLHFPSRYKMRTFGWLVYIAAIIFCIIRQYVFALKHSPWYEIYGKYFASAFTLGFWTPDNVTTSKTAWIILGVSGIIFDGILALYWFFCQLFIFFSVLTMWLIFNKLNKAWKKGYFEIKHLPTVI